MDEAVAEQARCFVELVSRWNSVYAKGVLIVGDLITHIAATEGFPSESYIHLSGVSTASSSPNGELSSSFRENIPGNGSIAALEDFSAGKMSSKSGEHSANGGPNTLRLLDDARFELAEDRRTLHMWLEALLQVQGQMNETRRLLIRIVQGLSSDLYTFRVRNKVSSMTALLEMAEAELLLARLVFRAGTEAKGNIHQLVDALQRYHVLLETRAGWDDDRCKVGLADLAA